MPDYYTLLDSNMTDGDGYVWTKGFNSAEEGVAIAQLEHLFEHVDYSVSMDPVWVATIALSGDSKAFKSDGDGKPGWLLATDVLCTHVQSIDAFFAAATPTQVDAYLGEFATGLKYVSEQTHERCVTALSRDPSMLQYVKALTPELCWFAVSEDASSLEHVPHDLRTEELCLKAVRENGYIFTVLTPDEQTDAICKVAADECPAIWSFVRPDLQTAELRGVIAARWPSFSESMACC